MHTVFFGKATYPSYASFEPQWWRTQDVIVLDKTHYAACDSAPERFGLCASMSNGTKHVAVFTNEADRERAFSDITQSHSSTVQSSPSTPEMSTSTTPSAAKTVLNDIKSFVSENRNTIYLIVAIFLLDHFFLEGRLVNRLKATVEKLLGKVEKKVDQIAGGAETSTTVAS